MNEQQLAAVKQALEALQFFKGLSLSMNEIERAEQAIADLEQALAAPVQEPVFCEYCGGNDDADFGLPTDHCTDCARPQPVPVKTYHDGKPWPVAPKPWVGLTDEEAQWIYDNGRTPSGMMEMVEAKLKEKNHDQ